MTRGQPRRLELTAFFNRHEVAEPSWHVALLSRRLFDGDLECLPEIVFNLGSHPVSDIENGPGGFGSVNMHFDLMSEKRLDESAAAALLP